MFEMSSNSKSINLFEFNPKIEGIVYQNQVLIASKVDIPYVVH